MIAEDDARPVPAPGGPTSTNGLDAAPRLRSAGAGAARRAPRRPVMLWVRRVHLYSGLLLFPWVLLYGVTALLFNHPGAFPDEPRRQFAAADVAGTGLDRLPGPAEAAAELVAALNEAADAGPMRRAYRLVEPESAAYTRDFIAARSKGEGGEHLVVLDIATGTGTVSTPTLPVGDRPPFAAADLGGARPLADEVKEGIRSALGRAGLQGGEPRITFGPELTFLVDVDGQVWRASYNVQTGALAGRRPGSGDGLGTREFLTRLHTSHGFLSRGWAKVGWAIVVDLMSAAMTFWGLSGLLMWWQMRSTRRAGAIVLGVGATVAALLAVGMHRILSAAQ